MRHLLVAATAGLMLASGAAYAQSGQGGYTGRNPTTNPSTVQPQGPAQPNYRGDRPTDGATSSGGSGVTGGSGQGGYLGTHPGGDPARSGQTVPPTSPPTQPRR